MVKTELFKTRADGVKLYRTYSDAGYTILQGQTGIEYVEAVDVEGSGHTYTETTTPAEVDEPTDDLETLKNQMEQIMEVYA